MIWRKKYISLNIDFKFVVVGFYFVSDLINPIGSRTNRVRHDMTPPCAFWGPSTRKATFGTRFCSAIQRLISELQEQITFNH